MTRNIYPSKKKVWVIFDISQKLRKLINSRKFIKDEPNYISVGSDVIEGCGKTYRCNGRIGEAQKINHYSFFYSSQEEEEMSLEKR